MEFEKKRIILKTLSSHLHLLLLLSGSTYQTHPHWFLPLTTQILTYKFVPLLNVMLLLEDYYCCP